MITPSTTATSPNVGGSPSLCVCGQVVDVRTPAFLIECHFCGQWFHGDCVRVSERDALQIAKFACGNCSKQGKTTISYPIVADGGMEAFDDMSFAPLPIHRGGLLRNDGSNTHNSDNGYPRVSFKKNAEAFRRLLKASIYAKSGLRVIPAKEMVPSYFKMHLLVEPILVMGNNWGVAGMINPFPVVGVQDISNLLTANCALRSVDVESQEMFNLSTRGWTMRLNDPSATPVNAHFRLSDTTYHRQVAAPVAISEIDWHYMLSNNGGNNNNNSPPSQPHVTANPDMFGAFLGMNTFQDFTITPGARSTWLSVSDGEVWVYLIPPTQDSLRAFHDWKCYPDAHVTRVFLAERVEKCIKCVIDASSTLIIPSGWLYALFSENGCSLFSGFFGNTLALATQLDVLALQASNTNSQEVSPYWKEALRGWNWTTTDVNAQLWAAICHYVRQLLIPDTNVRVSDHDKRLLVKALPALRRWSASAQAIQARDDVSWTPGSLREAQDIVNRLEQALTGFVSSFMHSCSHDSLGGSAILPVMGLSGLQQQQQHSLSKSSLPMITPNEANYIYSATAITDGADAASAWSAGDHPSGGFQASMWDEYNQHLTPDHLMDHNPYYQPHFNDSYSTSYSAQDYAPTIGGTGGYMDTARPPLVGHAPLSGMGMDSGVHHHQRLDGSSYADLLVRHRASCHRCGNLRKKNVRCPKCPHIFCQKCAEKMLEEHGDHIFVDGCPVCKEQCCCGKNRTTHCTRKFHCYKKCPATKRPSV